MGRAGCPSLGLFNPRAVHHCLTVGYFRDEEAIKEWRSDVEHRAAQRHGRAERYESRTLNVAKAERSHGFRREQG